VSSVPRALRRRADRDHQSRREKGRERGGGLGSGDAASRSSRGGGGGGGGGDGGDTPLVWRSHRGFRFALRPEALSAFEREGLIEPLDKHGRVYRVVDAERLSAPKA
jgi:hypothetical protein